MTNWLPLRVIMLFLSLWVAVAPTTLAAPAAAMAAQMSAAADRTAGDCDCCPNPAMDKGLCPFVCLNAGSFAIAPNSGDLSLKRSIAENCVHGYLALNGRSNPPEPPPPKSYSSR